MTYFYYRRRRVAAIHVLMIQLHGDLVELERVEYHKRHDGAVVVAIDDAPEALQASAEVAGVPTYI